MSVSSEKPLCNMCDLARLFVIHVTFCMHHEKSDGPSYYMSGSLNLLVKALV